jgi:hypothetical protein
MPTDPHILPTAALRATIARWAIAAAVLAVALTICGGVLNRLQPLTFGHDFFIGYVAGQQVAGGQIDRLYDASAMESAARSAIADANLTGNPAHVRWLNPAYFAAAFAPLAWLPYRWALLIWTALNAALAGGCLAVARAQLPAGSFRRLLPIIVCLSFPFILATHHQQSSLVSLSLLLAAASAWQSRRALLAGVFVGLLAYKPQIAFAIGLVLWAHQGRRALAGLLFGGGLWLALGEALWPGSTLAFLRESPAAVRGLQSAGFAWGRQITPTALLRGSQFMSPVMAAVLGGALSLAVLAGMVALARKARSAVQADAMIAAAFLAVPLAVPYLMDYDLLLLVVAAVCWMRSGIARELAVGWAVLWITAFVNVDVVDKTGVNAAVIVLAAMGGRMAVAVWRTSAGGRLGAASVDDVGFGPARPFADTAPEAIIAPRHWGREGNRREENHRETELLAVARTDRGGGLRRDLPVPKPDGARDGQAA